VLLHSLVPPPGQKPTRTYDTDRGRFLGRNGSIAYPAALAGARPALSGTTGATLDPVIAHGQEIELQPHTATRVAFISAAAEYREQALELTRQLNTWTSIDQILTHSQLDFDRGVRQIGLDSPQLIRAQRILSFLLYPVGALRASPHTMASNTLWQSGLWGFAVSGDYPIALVQVYKKDQLPLIREMLAMHAFWRSREVTIDLIVVNEREEGYDQELHRQIMGLLAETHSDEYLNQRGGVFVLRSTQISPESRVLLETSAQVILDGDTGSVAENLRRVPLLAAPLPVFEPLPAPGVIPAETPVLARPEDLLFDNEYGGFDPSGREYHIYLPPGKHTPAPWINVVANPESGFIVSESGTGYTWAGNSGENRLTTWHNDPVLDTSGEALYLRDEETAAVWSPTPAPMPADAPYLVRHGAGYSTFELSAHGLTHQLDMFVAPAAPVKIYHLQLRNTWQRARRLTVTFYAEWVLGTTRAATQQTIAPEFDAGSNGMLVRNVTSPDFRDGVAFAAADRQLHGITADRTEFLGRHGSQQRPAALQRVGLTGKVEAGLDPCAALQIHVELEPGAEEEIVFVIGQGDNHEDARRLINHFAGAATARETREAVVQRWDEILGTVQVETPELALNIVLNRWLLYQALSCRIWGRSALYQSSGAYGFRDQLQDVMALLHARPDLAREHIVRAAGHQFAEGDVLHWWHPPADRGVRTRISDDLLWLPYVTAHYIATTGDESILDEPVRYLDAAPLAAEEDERYAQYTAATEEFPIYDHCIRAIQRGATASERDLPLIGHGDWNDGMNRVGVDGRGESIWLGWFLIDVLNRFAPIAERRDDPSIAEEFRQRAEALRAALEEHAWDGDWYIRATYDDGAPLGSKTSEECQIDAIAQSWSVLSGAARPERAERAMAAASRRLIREDDGLIALLTPPFDNTARDPGYIKGYVPGIRENGGQYTHAAIWTAWAFAKLGDGDRASELFNLLNPITHTLNKQDCERYKVEPYVIVADVYSNEQHVGRGGWTWYTGSSGWMYRLGLEAILGIYRRGNQLHIAPAIPGTWESYTIVYRYGHAVYRLQIENPDGVTHGVRSLILDGESLTDPWIPLRDDDQEHSVRVVLG